MKRSFSNGRTARIAGRACVLALILVPGLAVAQDCGLVEEERAALQQDPMFSRPYIDSDEWRDEPVRHRYVHGGFEGTDTRFSYYLPPPDQYDGRFFQYITPIPDSEYLSQGASGEEDRIGFAIDSGAYFIETNGGGPRFIAIPGLPVDPTIAGYRANAAAARYSRIVAMAMYGCDRPYGYAYGGSGGGFRTIGGMENTEGVWDGAVPFVIGSPMAIPNVFTVRNYALRVLGPKLPAVADAVDVGSNVRVQDLLDKEELAAFNEVTKMGFPREAWYVHDTLDLHGFAVLFPAIVAQDPAYFSQDFWSKPGYEGHRPPLSLTAALVDHPTAVKRLLRAGDMQDAGLGAGGLADNAFEAMFKAVSADTAVALQLGSVPDKDLLGAKLAVTSGATQGATLLVRQFAGDVVILGGPAPDGLAAGDAVRIDNRDYLASQTYHRHQVPEQGYPVWDQFRDVDGKPLYPQRPRVLGPQFAATAAGSEPDGNFTGRMIVLSNLHDTEAYPWQGDWYLQQAKAHLGPKLNDHFRLWYTDRATHGDKQNQRHPTQTVSYLGVLQQALRDVSRWVEEGVAPAPTSAYRIVDGQIVMPSGGDERGGIQPVVVVQANGASRAEITTGDEVRLNVSVEVPPGTGKIVEVLWDFGGPEQFPERQVFTGESAGGTRESIELVKRHRFEIPGEYFVTVKAVAQRDGDVTTPYTRIRNLGRARVVVK